MANGRVLSTPALFISCFSERKTAAAFQNDTFFRHGGMHLPVIHPRPRKLRIQFAGPVPRAAIGRHGSGISQTPADAARPSGLRPACPSTAYADTGDHSCLSRRDRAQRYTSVSPYPSSFCISAIVHHCSQSALLTSVRDNASDSVDPCASAVLSEHLCVKPQDALLPAPAQAVSSLHSQNPDTPFPRHPYPSSSEGYSPAGKRPPAAVPIRAQTCRRRLCIRDAGDPVRNC